MKASTPIVVMEVAIDDLVPDPANPRRIEAAELEALTRSIQTYGFVQPVLARRETRVIIGGHQRMVAARRLGWKTVPTIFLDIDLEQARLLNLALNRISGDWDDELLARLLSDLEKAPGIDLSLSGFATAEVKGLLRKLDQREKRERQETFDLDEALAQARSLGRVQTGELWRLGDHRLLVGDATVSADVERVLAKDAAQLAFTDPPYNVAIGDHGGQQRGQRRRRLQNDALDQDAWQRFCAGWSRSLLDNVDGALYVCMSSKEWPTVAAALTGAGGHWSDTIIWAKDRFVLGRSDYHRQYEPIWYGWREGVRHYWRGDRDQGDVWRIERPSVSELHPTTKPLALVERAIENSSRPGERVLDLFLGSGSTLVACERTGRCCYGLEIDPVYASVALARWESFTGEQAERL